MEPPTALTLTRAERSSAARTQDKRTAVAGVLDAA